MIPIKILCGCGQKYAFEVEPIGGRMSGVVLCPVCGLDGSAAANQIIASQSPAQGPPPRARIGLQASAAAPPPPAPPLAGPRHFANGPAPARKMPRLWPAFGGIAILALVWAGVVTWRGAGRNRAPASSDAPVADAGPGTLGELAVSYVEPPVGRNAALFYTQGFAAMRIAKGSAGNLPLLGQASLPPLGAPMQGSMKSTLAALIRSNDEALKLFAQGAGLEQSRYPVDLSRGFETAFPHLPKIKGAVQLIELDAILRAENDEPGAAADDVLTALAVANSPAAEPSLFSQTVRAASVRTAVGALGQTLNRTSLPRESLSRLRAVLQKLEGCEARGEGFNRGLTAERIKWTALLSAPQKLEELAPALMIDLPGDQRAQIAAAVRQTSRLKEEQARFEAAFRQVMEARDESLPARLKVESLIHQKATETAPDRILSALLLWPGLAASSAQEAGCLASLRLGLTAVALEQFRAARHRYPGGLAELTPDYLPSVPLDPFDGQPLRYQTRGGGYLLHSIASDRKDDSGKKMNGKDADLVLAVVAPPNPLE